MPSPIALFVYNRPEHTRQTVEALQNNALAGESDLFIFSDAPRNEAASEAVAQVRRYVRGVSGFRSVTLVEREKNWGVDPSIIDGVTTLCARFGTAIVLEDDLVTSPWFLTYMNEGLTRYASDETVMQVGGFMFPLDGFASTQASFLPYTTCWGWGTWKRAWDHFDVKAVGFEVLRNDKRKRKAFDVNGAFYYFGMLQQFVEGRSDAWDIRWYLTVFLRNGLSLFPNRSLVNNIGFDGTGTHTHDAGLRHGEVSQSPVEHFPAVAIDRVLWQAIEDHLYSQQPRSLRNFVRKALR